mgnify:CR=1 FL=1
MPCPGEKALIAEIISQIYDAQGRQTNRPITRKKKRRFESSFPIARFLSEPLQVHCKNITELRKFLRSCKYVSDKEQFNREDYWLPPEQFEILKKGDWSNLYGMLDLSVIQKSPQRLLRPENWTVKS